MSDWVETVTSPPRGAFERRGGELQVEDCAVADLVSRYGTPLYVISELALRQRAREINSAFAAEWTHGEVTVLPAIKANHVVALHRILAQEGCGADLFGAGELEVAIRAGVDPKRISLNGTAKDLKTISRAVELGARVTLDSLHEIELARQAAQDCGRRADVRVRVRPLFELEMGSEPYGGMPIREAFGRYKPGIPWEDLTAAGEALKAPELDLSGVMMHFGRHTTDLDGIGHVIDRYVALIAELEQRWDGWTPATIDVGGGIAHLGDPHGRAGRVTPEERFIPTIREYATTICNRLADGLTEAGIDPAGRKLEVEPGRAMFGPCGIHLSRVLHTKRQATPFPQAWMELDTSQVFLPDIVLESCRYPIALASAPATGVAKETFDVVGVACSSDVLAHDELLPALEPGTVVAFGLTGAYQDAGATNFNVLPRPATVLVSGAETHIVRRAETVDDVLSRDVTPDYLRLPSELGTEPPA
jgi:diaminopimelate decarboxylase